MKKNLFILTLASLTLAVVGATASTQDNSTVTQLPTYRFETARYTPAERAIEAGLAELRATAKMAAPRVAAPLVMDQAATDKATLAAKIAKQPATATRVANN